MQDQPCRCVVLFARYSAVIELLMIFSDIFRGPGPPYNDNEQYRPQPFKKNVLKQ